jgi:hypothetical protein
MFLQIQEVEVGWWIKTIEIYTFMVLEVKI